MIKSLVYSSILMIILMFLWWFSGGTIVGINRHPAPVEKATAFVWENFQLGLATVFNAVIKVLPF